MSLVTIDNKLFCEKTETASLQNDPAQVQLTSWNGDGEEGKSFIAHAAAGKLMIQCYNQLNKSCRYRQ